MNGWGQGSVICWASVLVVMPVCVGAAAPASAPSAAAATSAESAISLAVLNGASSSGQGESDMAMGELTKAMEASAGLKVLDRDHIEKLLAEHQLSLIGVVRQPVKQGGMLGAKYFLYAQMERNASATTLAILCIEVSSGNVIWEKAFANGAITDPKTIGRWTADVARDALAAMTANEGRRDRPSATVLAVANRSRSSRLDFLENSLNGLLEDLLESRGYRLLRRRNPGLLAKETTLGISGMVRPDAAVLAEAADLVVTASFAESPSGDVAFEQTPIKLTLGLKRRGESGRDTAFTFTLAELKRLTDELRSALPPAKAGARSAATTATADDPVSRRLEAARLMAELKDLPYTAPLEDHRRQIELVQRVIYLDPSAKEVYWRLGIELDALTRQTWGMGGTHEGSSQATCDAFHKYLGFPRTDKEHVWSALRCLLNHESFLNKETPEKCIPVMAEFVRWEHHLDPVKPPYAIVPDNYFPDWWDAHPQRRLEFYAWVDRLYENKQHLSVLPFEVAVAYEQLKQYDKAAEYYYDGFVSHHFSRLELNSVTCAAGSFDSARSRAQDLAKYLDAERSAKLLARLGAVADKPAPNPGDLYGKTYGEATDLWGYYLSADKYRLATFDCRTAKPEPVMLPQPIRHSVAIRLTQAGLWVQGLNSDNQLALLFSPEPGKWETVPTPDSMKQPGRDQQDDTHVITMVQLGQEVLFATGTAGIHVYDLSVKSWRDLGTKEGLPSLNQCVDNMVLDADRQSVWITGGDFLSRYGYGKLHLSADKLAGVSGTIVLNGGELVFRAETTALISFDPMRRQRKTLVSGKQQRLAIPVPSSFWAPARSSNAGISSKRRIASCKSRLFLVSELGLQVLDARGELQATWRPDGFFWWNGLGGWVSGNCALPPCTLMEVVADDQDDGLLWLVSKSGETIPPYEFFWAKMPAVFSDNLRKDSAQCFITAFRPGSACFSKPVRVDGGFIHMQPRGDSIYMTGSNVSVLSKNLWTTDQPSRNDEPLRVECPDTPVGRASRALLLGQREQAMKCLHEALDAGISPSEVKKMIRDLSRQTKPSSQPATRPVSPATKAPTVPARQATKDTE